MRLTLNTPVLYLNHMNYNIQNFLSKQMLDSNVKDGGKHFKGLSIDKSHLLTVLFVSQQESQPYQWEDAFFIIIPG